MASPPVSALISVPCNRRAVPKLPLTFLGCEFTCLVSAFGAQSKLACCLLYLAIANNSYTLENSAMQPSLEMKDHHFQLFLLTREEARVQERATPVGNAWLARSESDRPDGWAPASGK